MKKQKNQNILDIKKGGNDEAANAVRCTENCSKRVRDSLLKNAV